MANRNTVGFGLNATGTMGSNYTNQGQSNYFIDAADATAIYNGQPVKLTSGYIVTATAAITNNALGVFNGCFYNAASTQKPTWNNYYPGANYSSKQRRHYSVCFRQSVSTCTKHLLMH